MKTSYSLSKTINYIQNIKDGSVYKVLPDHFLRMSPSDIQDRRVYEIEDNNYKMLTFENACMIVNKQFSETNERWTHKGRKYLASATSNRDLDEHTYLLTTLPNHNLIKRTKNLLDSIDNDNSISITSKDGMTELKMIKHKGKIYYILIINEFLPRVKMYNLFGEFCQWCNIKHCKPIFDLDNKRYV